MQWMRFSRQFPALVLAILTGVIVATVLTIATGINPLAGGFTAALVAGLIFTFVYSRNDLDAEQ